MTPLCCTWKKSNLGGVGPNRGLPPEDDDVFYDLFLQEQIKDIIIFGGEEEGGGVRSGPGEARTILLLHIISARPSKHPLMVRTFLKVHMELGSYFVSARTKKRHHPLRVAAMTPPTLTKRRGPSYFFIRSALSAKSNAGCARTVHDASGT